MFSGDKWYHNHGVLGSVAPDGMMYDFFDGPLGRNNDRQFMNASQLNDSMNTVCSLIWLVGNMYYAYTDKGFTTDTNIKSAHHGPAIVTPQQFRDNMMMSSVRVCIEWSFTKLKQVAPILTRKSILRLGAINVPKLLRVAQLQTNVHTCLKQSQTGLFFNCSAPTLEQYFAFV